MKNEWRNMARVKKVDDSLLCVTVCYDIFLKMHHRCWEVSEYESYEHWSQGSVLSGNIADSLIHFKEFMKLCDRAFLCGSCYECIYSNVLKSKFLIDKIFQEYWPDSLKKFIRTSRSLAFGREQADLQMVVLLCYTVDSFRLII